MKPQSCGVLAALAALAVLWGVTGAAAQTGGGFDLSWNVIAGGGATGSSGDAFEVDGTVGQPATNTLSGENFVLTSGVWAGVVTRPAPWGGDCPGEGRVRADELIPMVNIALGLAPVSDCPAGDANHDGQITVDEILQAVTNALNGCP